MKSRYTDVQIKAAFDKYYRKTDSVIDVLRLAPLNQIGIHTVVNASNDFCIINSVKQYSVGKILIGTIEDKFVMCRELALNKNKFPLDKSLISEFTGMPLEVEENPFFLVAYDQDTFRYAEENSRIYQEFEKGKVLYTKKEVPFYLTTDKDVNSIFPLRISLGEISLLMKRKHSD